MSSVTGNVGIGVLILARERRNFGLRPATVPIARNEDGPAREIRRHFEKINFPAIGRQRGVRLVIAGRNYARREQRRMRKRLCRIVRSVLGGQWRTDVVTALTHAKFSIVSRILWFTPIQKLDGIGLTTRAKSRRICCASGWMFANVYPMPRCTWAISE